MKNICIFASGSGSNAENISKYFKERGTASVSLILTENPNAYVLERAKTLNIPGVLFTMEQLQNGSLLRLLREHSIHFIVLAGFLKLIPGAIIGAYPNRIVNIHPALLPRYGGKGMYGNRVHQAVIAAGERESGITIHYVNSHYDEGDIIFQAKCPVMPNDTIDTLACRVHELEYAHYPLVIEQLVNKL